MIEAFNLVHQLQTQVREMSNDELRQTDAAAHAIQHDVTAPVLRHVATAVVLLTTAEVLRREGQIDG